jgi:hypothetical protein
MRWRCPPPGEVRAARARPVASCPDAPPRRCTLGTGKARCSTAGANAAKCPLPTLSRPAGRQRPPPADERPPLLRLLALGLLAGAPAILGALIGAAVNNAELSALLLGVGVGAIVQVIVQVLPAVRGARDAFDPLAVGGVAGGVLIMYATGLLVPA